MDSLLPVGVMLIFALAILFLWFYMKRRQLCRVHRQKVLELKSEISNHETHIKIRSAYLNTYDFLKYNLDEALGIQPAIETR